MAQEPPKAPVTAEKSLGYIAWDIKKMTQQLERLNDNFEKFLLKTLDNDDCPL